MKKKYLFMFMALMLSLCIIPIVSAKESVGNESALTEAIGKLSQGDVEIELTQSIELQTLLTISNQTANKLTIDFKGNTITRKGTDGDAVVFVEHGNVTFKDTSTEKGGITRSDNKPALWINNTDSNVTLEGGVYKNNNATAEMGTILVRDGATLTVTGNTEIMGYFGITPFGENVNVNVSGGTIKAHIGISGNANETINSHIKITGGTIESESVAIYQPQSGDLTVSAGVVQGAAGIIARQGTITVKENAKIIGTGSNNIAVGATNVNLPNGSAIIVDNVTSGYKTDALVKIEGGTLEATADNAINALNDTGAKDYEITGGNFNKPFADNYLKEEFTEIKSGNKYYVGDDADKFVKEATSGTTIEVLKGGLEVDSVAEGVIIKKAEGNEETVTVNGHVVSNDEEYTVPTPSTSGGVTPKPTPSKDYTITEGVSYEDNGEDIEIEGSVVKDQDATYEAMIKYATENGYAKLYNMYEIHIKDNKSLTKLLTITFDLGKENEGKEVYIVHQRHDNTYEEWEREVENGKVTITVSELSPFVVMLKETKEVVNNPQTSSMNIMLYGIGGVVALGGLVLLNKKRKANN